MHGKIELCYSNVEDAYKSYKLPPIGDSDQVAAQLCTAYVTQHRKMKYKFVSKSVIANETIDRYKHVFQTTDWDAFFDVDLDSAT